MEITLTDNKFAQALSFSGYAVPENITWCRDGKPRQIMMFTDRHIQEVTSFKARVKNCICIAWIIEPVAINSNNYNAARAHRQSYDYIMSHNINFLSEFPAEKRVFCPGFGSSLYEYEWQMYPKTKDVLTVVGNKNKTVGHRFRHDVVRMFGSRVDVMGRSCNPFPPEKRAEIYAPYRFQIAIHNSVVEDYWTDILIDCFLTGTVPIVWGGEFLSKYFNAEGYLVFNTLEELEKILTSVESGDIKYDQFLPAIWDNFDRARKLAVTEDYLYDNFLNNFVKSWVQKPA